MKLTHWKILTITLIILLAGSVIYLTRNSGSQNPENKINQEEAANKVISYLNENILNGKTQASLLKIVEENGLYKLSIKIGDQQADPYLTRDGKLLFPEAIDLDVAANRQKLTKNSEIVEGNFVKLADTDICRENSKPIIYFFGSSNCPHCHWEYPIIQEVVNKFQDKISFHDNMGEIKDKEIFNQYSDGGVPTIVLGCRYFRLGSGEAIGKEKEIEALTKIIEEILR